jgi:hypothetical protein
MPELAARLWQEYGARAAPATLSRLLCRRGFTYKKQQIAAECARADVRDERRVWMAQRQPRMREQPHRGCRVNGTLQQRSGRGHQTSSLPAEHHCRARPRGSRSPHVQTTCGNGAGAGPCRPWLSRARLRQEVPRVHRRRGPDADHGARVGAPISPPGDDREHDGRGAAGACSDRPVMR